MTAVAPQPVAVLHQGASAARLGVVRAAVFAIWLAIVVPDPLSFLAALPPSMAHPVGVLRWLPDALVRPAALDAFKTVLVALLVACAVGVRGFRVLAPVTAVLLTVHQELVREYTFTNHEELALLVCTWVLALFGAADGFAWPRRRPAAGGVYATALQAMAFFLLLPYCAIAAHRLAFAAPDVFTGDSLPYWLASLHSLDRDGWGTGISLLGHSAPIALLKAGFAITTLFELVGPLCLVLPRFARVWGVVAIGFHVVNWFTLNLFFWQNALLVALLVLGGTGRSSAAPRGR